MAALIAGGAADRKDGADHQGGTGWRNRGPQEATGKPRTGAALPGLLFLQHGRTASRTAQEAARRAQSVKGARGADRVRGSCWRLQTATRTGAEASGRGAVLLFLQHGSGATRTATRGQHGRADRRGRCC
jgi:hypothetical protein